MSDADLYSVLEQEYERVSREIELLSQSLKQALSSPPTSRKQEQKPVARERGTNVNAFPWEEPVHSRGPPGHPYPSFRNAMAGSGISMGPVKDEVILSKPEGNPRLVTKQTPEYNTWQDSGVGIAGSLGVTGEPLFFENRSRGWQPMGASWVGPIGAPGNVESLQATVGSTLTSSANQLNPKENRPSVCRTNEDRASSTDQASGLPRVEVVGRNPRGWSKEVPFATPPTETFWPGQKLNGRNFDLPVTLPDQPSTFDNWQRKGEDGETDLPQIQGYTPPVDTKGIIRPPISQTLGLSPIMSAAPGYTRAQEKATGQTKPPVLSTPKSEKATGEVKLEKSHLAKERPIIKPDRYDGKTPWKPYLKHFEMCAAINGWDDKAKCQYLAVLLTGSAQQTLSSLQAEAKDYKRLVKSLESRFDPLGRKELHRAQLRNRRRKPSESLVEMAEEVRQLVEKVYADLPEDSRDRMGRDHFLDALLDSEIRTRIIQMRTSSLDEAVAAAVELEALYKAEKERRSADVRKVRSATVEAVQAEKPTSEANAAATDIQRQLTDVMEQLKRLGKQVDDTKKAAWNNRRKSAKKGVQCFRCQRFGHIKAECPESGTKGAQENGQGQTAKDNKGASGKQQNQENQ